MTSNQMYKSEIANYYTARSQSYDESLQEAITCESNKRAER